MAGSLRALLLFILLAVLASVAVASADGADVQQQQQQQQQHQQQQQQSLLDRIVIVSKNHTLHCSKSGCTITVPEDSAVSKSIGVQLWDHWLSGDGDDLDISECPFNCSFRGVCRADHTCVCPVEFEWSPYCEQSRWELLDKAAHGVYTVTVLSVFGAFEVGLFVCILYTSTYIRVASGGPATAADAATATPKAQKRRSQDSADSAATDSDQEPLLPLSKAAQMKRPLWRRVKLGWDLSWSLQRVCYIMLFVAFLVRTIYLSVDPGGFREIMPIWVLRFMSSLFYSLLFTSFNLVLYYWTASYLRIASGRNDVLARVRYFFYVCNVVIYLALTADTLFQCLSDQSVHEEYKRTTLFLLFQIYVGINALVVTCAFGFYGWMIFWQLRKYAPTMGVGISAVRKVSLLTTLTTVVLVLILVADFLLLFTTFKPSAAFYVTFESLLRLAEFAAAVALVFLLGWPRRGSPRHLQILANGNGVAAEFSGYGQKGLYFARTGGIRRDYSAIGKSPVLS